MLVKEETFFHNFNDNRSFRKKLKLLVYLIILFDFLGIIDPTKVIRTALQDAAGVASLLATTVSNI